MPYGLAIASARSRIALVATALCLIAAPLTAGPAQAEEPLSPELLSAAEIRAVYGLDASPATVRRLAGSSADVGTQSWGFPMTAEESARLDLEGQTAFADQVSAEILPKLERVPEFGGLWLDPARKGRLTIAFTRPMPDLEAEVTAGIGQSPGYNVEIVPYSRAELRTAAQIARAEWAKLSDVPLHAVAADTRAKAVRIEVDAESLPQLDDERSALAERLGVAVIAVAGQPAEDVACPDRDHCTTPMKAGTLIRRGSSSGPRCTMAFHILISGNARLLTAGHCSHGTLSDNWYHVGYGYVGAVQSNLITSHDWDVARVQMSNSQDSDVIFGENAAVHVQSYRAPIVGENLWIALGVSRFSGPNANGVVADDWTSWTSTTSNTVVWGGDVTCNCSPGPQGGDSGSPMYRYSNGNFIAVGVLNTSLGQFARVNEAMLLWGGSMR